MDLDIELLKKYYHEFDNLRCNYEKMENYYEGKHDIEFTYNKDNERSDRKSTRNYIRKFVDDETAFVAGVPVNYISSSNNEQYVKDIEYNLSHWSKKHDIDEVKKLGIFKQTYELFYEDVKKQFSSILLKPSEAFIVKDEFNNIQYFVREYTKKFDSKKYLTVYTPTNIYNCDNNFNIIGEVKENLFGEVPVSNGEIDSTIYDKIKSLQDDFNLCNSDQMNLSGDLRYFYMVVYGIDPNDPKNKPFIQNINKNSILFFNGKAKLEKFEKTVNDTFIQNLRNNTKEDMYELVGHINMQQSPTSNTSGEQIINRMIQLKFRCNLISATLQDMLRERIRFLFIWLKRRHNKDYDYKDISPKITLNVPKDWLIMANVISQLQDLLSDETKISLLPLDHSPQVEIEKKIREEKAKIEREKEYEKYLLPNDYEANKGDKVNG